MTDTEGPATIDEARRIKREVEKRISEILRNYQRAYGVTVTGVDSDTTEFSKGTLVVNRVRLRVEF